MMYSVILLLLVAGFHQIGSGDAKALHQDAKLKIVRGNEAKRGTALYMMYILSHVMDKKTKMREWKVCGGTLISEYHVLTAAHCVDDANMVQMYPGIHNRTLINQDTPYIEIYDWYIPKDYSSQTLANDIAVIRLPEPLKLTSPEDYAKLPQESDANNTYVGSIARTYGWGATRQDDMTPSSVLRYVDVEVMARLPCQFYLANYNRSGYDVPEGDLCTSKADFAGTCDSDAGGPLLVDGVQIGITSFGVPECEEDYPDVYVNVGYYLQWIKENMQ